MLTTVEVITPFSGVPVLTIPVINPDDDAPLKVRNITGLEPVTAVVSTKNYSQQDGEFYLGSSVPKRNIVLTLGMNANRGSESVNEARDLIYGYFMPKTQVTLRFTTDHMPQVQIDGYVESAVPNRFSDDPETVISVICPQPNMVGVDVQTVSGLADADPEWTEFVSRGNLTSGYNMRIHAEGDALLSLIVVENTSPITDVVRQLLISQSLYAIDSQVEINSTQGDKRIDYIRPSIARASLLKLFGAGSLWPYVVPGANRMRVVMPTPGEGTPRPWEMTYVEQYGGI